MDDVELKQLLPPEYFEGSVDDFFARLPELDPYFEHLRRDAADNGRKLRFVASLESDGKVKAGLMEIDSAHPFFWLESSNNIIALRTSRYNDYPVVIKGYGAGAEVTAAGVFADIISIANIR